MLFNLSNEISSFPEFSTKINTLVHNFLLLTRAISHLYVILSTFCAFQLIYNFTIPESWNSIILFKLIIITYPLLIFFNRISSLKLSYQNWLSFYKMADFPVKRLWSSHNIWHFTSEARLSHFLPWNKASHCFFELSMLWSWIRALDEVAILDKLVIWLFGFGFQIFNVLLDEESKETTLFGLIQSQGSLLLNSKSRDCAALLS